MTIKKKELFILYGETYLKLRTENQIDKSNITYSIPLDYEGQVPIFLEIKNATSSKVIDYQIIDDIVDIEENQQDDIEIESTIDICKKYIENIDSKNVDKKELENKLIEIYNEAVDKE